MSMERVLVTGATGFVGSNLVKAAEGKYEVVPTSHHPFDAMSLLGTRHGRRIQGGLPEGDRC